MSISIGIGVKVINSCFSARLAMLAKQFGYATTAGIDSFERDVQQGVGRLVELREWTEVFSLRAPVNRNANLAFDVYKELIALQVSAQRPVFFDFCEALAQSANQHGMHKLGIFFATEWSAADRIRMSYGNLIRLFTILSLPGHWTVNTLNPMTGRMEEWDELPFFYELECGGHAKEVEDMQ